MKNFFNWSGGKDSSFALYKALQKGVKVDLLLTTLSEKYRRISMHGVKEKLLDQQARQLGIPIKKIFLPEDASMEDYNQIYTGVLNELKSEGFTTAYFGDIYLEDLRKYREAKLAEVGISTEFPIWGIPTNELAISFLDEGFQTKIVAINSEKLDKSFVGLDFSKDFLEKLPNDVDPCGENGEFHSFCFEGPIYSKPISIQVDEIIERTYDLDKEKGLKSTYYFAELNLK